MRHKRIKKSQYPYLSLKVGEVVVWRAPFGPKDIWGSLDKGSATATEHKQAILHAERKLGAEFMVRVGDGCVIVSRVR